MAVKQKSTHLVEILLEKEPASTLLLGCELILLDLVGSFYGSVSTISPYRWWADPSVPGSQAEDSPAGGASLQAYSLTISSCRWYGGLTPLYLAVKQKSPQLVEMLVEEGAASRHIL
jgi:hypothetical protein